MHLHYVFYCAQSPVDVIYFPLGIYDLTWFAFNFKNLDTLEIGGIPWVTHFDQITELFTEKKWMTWCKDHVSSVMDSKVSTLYVKFDMFRLAGICVAVT